MIKTSRRQFLGIAGATAGALLTNRNLLAWAIDSRTRQAPWLQSPRHFRYSTIPKCNCWMGRCVEQFDHNHDLFLHLDEDALLKPFRDGRECLPRDRTWADGTTTTTDFSPPDNFHAFIPGHSFGQYLSALARAYAVTGSKPTQEKVHRLVRAFAQRWNLRESFTWTIICLLTPTTKLVAG